MAFEEQKSTKIVATLGPASVDHVEALILAGVNVFRINFSHSSLEHAATAIDRIRAANDKLGTQAAVLCDLQGPKFRTGALENHEPVVLETGRRVRFVTGGVGGPGSADAAGGNASAPVPILTTGTEHAHVCIRQIQVGQRILLDDGAISIKVAERVSRDEVVCTVEVGGIVKEHKGINVPDMSVPLPALTDEDLANAAFALEQDVEFIALSFVQRALDVTQLRRMVKKAYKGRGDDARPPRIIAKIEKPQAIDNIDAILAAADGIMVARGDMGVECSLEKVPSFQKLLIRKANEAGKFVITATQMLESMTHSPSPTRAEVSDVANAVYDGTGATMLSGETAVGAYPVQTVEIMSSITREAEHAMEVLAIDVNPRPPNHPRQFGYSIAEAAAAAAKTCQAKVIVMLAYDVEIPLYLSNLRPPCPVIAATFNAKLARQLSLVYGCHPIVVDPPSKVPDSDEVLAIVENELYKLEAMRSESAFVFTCPTKAGNLPGLSHSLSLNHFGRATKLAAARSKWSLVLDGASAVNDPEDFPKTPKPSLDRIASIPFEEQPLPPSILVIGAPGAGKSELSQRLQSECPHGFVFQHIWPTQLLKDMGDDPEAAEARASGGAKMDALLTRLVNDATDDLPVEVDIAVLDGFPASLGAAELFFKQDLVNANRVRLVLVFAADESELLARIGDTPAMRKRLAFHRENTPAVVGFFEARGCRIKTVNTTTTTPDDVFEQVSVWAEQAVRE